MKDFEKSLSHRLRIAAGRFDRLALKIEESKDQTKLFRKMFRYTLDYMKTFEKDFDRYAQRTDLR